MVATGAVGPKVGEDDSWLLWRFPSLTDAAQNVRQVRSWEDVRAKAKELGVDPASVIYDPRALDQMYKQLGPPPPEIAQSETPSDD